MRVPADSAAGRAALDLAKRFSLKVAGADVPTIAVMGSEFILDEVAVDSTNDRSFNFDHKFVQVTMRRMARVEEPGLVLDAAEPAAPPPIPIRLTCPGCGKLHVDEGRFATKPHHTHACQFCGMAWRPAIMDTVGVKFLPGFKNDDPG